MFDDLDTGAGKTTGGGGLFAGVDTSKPKAPLVSNGLFGSSDFIEDQNAASKSTSNRPKSKIDSIFDSDDEEENKTSK